MKFRFKNKAATLAKLRKEELELREVEEALRKMQLIAATLPDEFETDDDLIHDLRKNGLLEHLNDFKTELDIEEVTE